MRRGAVSLVALPPPTRVPAPHRRHHPVSVNLGHDRGGRHAEKVAIGPGGRQNPASEVARGHMIGDHGTGGPGQRERRCSHRETGGFEDVDAVDDLGADLADRPTGALSKHPRKGLFSLLGGQFFGVPHAAVNRDLLETGGADHDRSRERAATDLIDADDRVGLRQQAAVPRTENDPAGQTSPFENSIAVEGGPGVRRHRSIARGPAP